MVFSRVGPNQSIEWVQIRVSKSFCPLVNLLSSLFATSDPSNVSSLVHSAEMRVAETRAVNRALRKA